MVETSKSAELSESELSESELSEAVWQAWVEKNKAQDRFRFKRRLRVMGFVAMFGLVAALLWKLIG